MYTYDDLYTIFSEELKKQNFTKEPAELYEPIRYAISQCGKRLRPILTLMACDLFEVDIQHAIYQAIAIELLHNFSLIQDDVMDQSPIRHGKITVYKKWSPNIAILAADTLYALAYKYIVQAKVEKLPALLDTFNNTAIKTCTGQQMDLNFEKKATVTKDDYLLMSQLKTALLFAASLKIGAIVAGAPEKDANHLYNFGVNIGMAFQLKDDLLDVYGDEKVFGKKTGEDILENKKTFLFVSAMELADDKTRHTLMQLSSDTKLAPQDKINAIKIIFDQLNIRQHTEQAIDNYLDKGLLQLQLVDRPAKSKVHLIRLANKMIQRIN